MFIPNLSKTGKKYNNKNNLAEQERKKLIIVNKQGT